MSSGVKVSDEVVTKYNELKTGRQYKYVIFKINDTNDEIIVEKVSGKNDTYDMFIGDLKALPKEECRYAVYDFEWTTSEGGQRNKICFYTWCPDTGAMKKKMLYASSKDAIKKKLVGLGAEIQGTDFSEIDQETILERVSKGPGNA